MKCWLKNDAIYYKSARFDVSDSLQTYTVPDGVTSVVVDCVASKGWTGGNTGGKGGRVQCELEVTPNQTLYVMVGAIPTSQAPVYNASDIRTDNTGITDTTSLQSRLVVAGGGGSSARSGLNTPGAGGQGGGLIGGNGGNGAVCTGAGGGSQSAGGSRGGTSAAYPYYGSAGSFGLGGTGASGGSYGGGGGAGWYGGGGGSGGGAVYSNVGSGGGGGSSYTNENLCTNVTHTQGYQDGTGYITISHISDASDYTYKIDDYTAKVVDDNGTYKAFRR